MAATTAIGIGVASSAYSAYQASKKPKAPVLPPDPLVNAPNTSVDALNAARAGEVAAAKARKRVTPSTILTSPQGLNTPAPGKTLLLGR